MHWKTEPRPRILIGCMLMTLPFAGIQVSAQDLAAPLEQQPNEGPTCVMATFKSGRVINTHSIENNEKNDLNLEISHRFGRLNSGFYDFFGLDAASTRLGLSYGITDYFSAGIGRSTYQKTWDAYLKFKLLRQGEGAGASPFTFSIVSIADITTLNDTEIQKQYTLLNRLSYVTQLLLARKFGPRLSLQFCPAYVHKNLVPQRIDQNSIFTMGLAGRYTLSNRTSLNAEYHHILQGQTAEDFENSLSLGFDIETRGHVFQVHLSNSRSVIERGFLTETSGNWLDGDIHFGFNIIRVFGLGK